MSHNVTWPPQNRTEVAYNQQVAVLTFIVGLECNEENIYHLYRKKI
jgi:hypothetical protein